MTIGLATKGMISSSIVQKFYMNDLIPEVSITDELNVNVIITDELNVNVEVEQYNI